jgi:hypothetical protein
MDDRKMDGALIIRRFRALPIPVVHTPVIAARFGHHCRIEELIMSRFSRLPIVVVTFAFLAMLAAGALATEVARRVPAPLPGHPGNVFLEGQEMVLSVPAAATGWQITDIDGHAIAARAVGEGQGHVSLGRRDVGWYRIVFLDTDGQQVAWTTAGVLAGWKTPVPDDSPICADSATAWFARHYHPDERKHQEILANLAALAGVNWIRDRLSWGEMEPRRGTFAEETRYDSSADAATDQGLQVLQVFHSTPGWAVDKRLDGARAGGRFPRDLRDQYAFCRAMAERFRGSVAAWEPWNEANIEVFGGHTIDEMCSLQKAAYLGFKAGDPDVCVCWNVYAGSGSPLHSQGVIANEAWPYFETYNIHSYSTPEQYVSQFATARDAACGRPLWITECGIRLNTGDERPWGDLSPEDERRQAAFIARSYATSLFAGVQRHFFFILGNYIENGVQFGLLRHDHTPRPGYVALAAVGRFLAGAECLGRVSPTVYAFRARPDGREQDVLVAWGEDTPWPLPADLHVQAVFDHLGRSLGTALPATLGPNAMFVLLPPEEANGLELESPPELSPRRDGQISPVVLQLSLPANDSRLDSQSHRIQAGRQTELPLYVYNFGRQPVSGTLAVEEAPQGWQLRIPADSIRIDPLDRRPVPATVTAPATGRELLRGTWIKLRGDFGDAGRPVLAFRLAADLMNLQPAQTRPVASAGDAANWQDNIVPQGVMSHRAGDPSGVTFEMQFADTDPWAYPRLLLVDRDVPDSHCDGLALKIHLHQGTGTVRVQFIEQDGAAYLADADVDPARQEPQRVVVLFRDCRWGPYSQPDSDGRLQPADIREVLVGINAERNSQVKMTVSDLEWVRY